MKSEISIKLCIDWLEILNVLPLNEIYCLYFVISMLCHVVSSVIY